MADYAEVLGKVLRGDYDDASPEERDGAVRALVNLCSAAAAAVAFQPIPFVDVALISPIQVGMVQGIARVYGHKLDQRSIMEILSTFGASLVAQNVLMAAAKFVPVLGWLAAVSMAYATTWAIGEVSDHYFRNGRGVPADELRSMFQRTYQQKRSEKEKQHRADDTLKRRLDQLKEAHAAGLIDDEEMRVKKEQILKDF
jgi:uncharacterized protein (DUF697 family)